MSSELRFIQPYEFRRVYEERGMRECISIRRKGVYLGICRRCCASGRKGRGNEGDVESAGEILRDNRTRTKCRKVKNNKVYERKKGKEDRIVIEGTKNRKNKRV